MRHVQKYEDFPLVMQYIQKEQWFLIVKLQAHKHYLKISL